MARRLIWSPEAADDFENIIAHVEASDPLEAKRLAQSMMEKIESIPEFPELGRMIPEYQNPRYRERIHLKSFRITYKILPEHEAIEIVHIFRSVQQLPGGP